MAALYSTLTEIAMIRISTKSGTILLPGTSTIQGRQVGFKDYLGTLTSNSTVTFSTQNGDFFEDGTTSKVFSNAYAFGTFYTGSTSRWNIIGGNVLASMNVTSMNVNALQVNSLTIGTGTGWLGLNPIQTLAVSTIQTNTSTLYANTAFMGGASTLTAIQFYGLTGTYSNTVIAEQSTGTGLQEFVVFRGSSASDRIRMQTTGSIVFEPGVAARTFTGAAALATPTMTMLSNLVGIGTTGTPGALLDVAGTGRFQLTSTLGLNVSSINSAAYPPPSAVPSNLIVSTLTASSTIQGSSFYGNAQGLSWSQSGSVGGQNWSAVTGGVSSGIYYACVNGGYIYYSTNGGVTWTQQATVQAWTGIAAGSTAGVAFACVTGGGIYYTTNSGTTWTLSSAPTATWSCCAINTANSSGFACINGGGIYYTADGGATWTISTAPTANWNSCTLADTITWMAINTNLSGVLYYSQDSGATFTALSGTPTQTGLFNSITMSRMSGQYIMFLGSSGTSYATNISSTFNPSTWRVLTGITGYIGANNAGTVIVNANPNNPIKVSYDNGNTWIITNSPSLPWSCVLRGQLPLVVSAFSLPSTTSINPCLIGTNTGFIYTNVPFANIPRTDIIGHNITIADDTSVLTLTGTMCRISTLGAVDVASKSQINLAVDNGYLNLNAYTRVDNTKNFYLPKNTQMASPTGTDVRQPLIQYGTASGSGGSGTVVVTIPQAYTTSSSYVVQVTMRDSPTAELYATPTATNSFTIGWSSSGSGTQTIMWTTFGI